MANLAFGVSGKTIAATSTLTALLGVKNAAQQAITLDKILAGFDGTNSANGPAQMDVCTCTFATNAPGTNSTTVTPAAYDSGRPETIQSSGGKAWTAQPTVLTIVESFTIPTYMGSALAPLPMMKPLIAKGGNGIVLDVTLPASVTANMTGTLACTE